MSRRALAVVFAVVAAILAGIILLLATGGGGGGDSSRIESPGDVEVGDGPAAPEDTGLADILFSDVTAEGGEFVFEARLGGEVPERLEGAALDLRWDIFEAGEETWIVSANFDVGPNASVLSADTSFGVSTFDGGLVGSVERDTDRLIVRFDPSTIEDFPRTFEWRLTTLLDAAPGDPTSALARDRVPNEGLRRFPGA